jgi:hypothetical protein
MNRASEVFHPALVYGLETWDLNSAFPLTGAFGMFDGVWTASVPQVLATVVDNLLPPIPWESQESTSWPSHGEFIELEQPRPTRYQLLKKLEGTVLRSDEQCFTARLAESSGDFPPIEFEIELDELPEEERSFAVDGASLVWTIGYRYQGGTKKRESEIYFRRLPPWTASEADKALAAARETMNAIWK